MLKTPKKIIKFDIKKYEEIKNDPSLHHLDLCSFTQEPYEDDTQVMILPCKHYFSLDPIKTWLIKHSNKCPICRKEIAKGVPDHLRDTVSI